MFVVPGYKVPAEEEQNNFVGWHKVFVEETKISQFWAETFKACLCSAEEGLTSLDGVPH